MAEAEPPRANNVYPDVSEELQRLMGEAGSLVEAMGTLRIHVHHSRAFPWDEVFKTLLWSGFQVFVTRKEADIIIEAKP